MITSTFTVTSAATLYLTTRAAVKTALGITSTDEDAYIDTLLPRVTWAICNYLGVASAADGTRTIGRETLVETFRLTREEDRLRLSRWPVVSITSVVEDDDTLASDEYEVDKATGLLRRMDGDDNVLTWVDDKVVVTYVAGWLLPGDASRNLPYDIEDAAIGLIKAARAARKRDPMVKEEDIPGVRRISYWVGSISDADGFPDDLAAKLAHYRDVVV